jgi:hypothetical protein
MPRSATPENKASTSPKRNQSRWSPEARQAQKRRATERAAASLVEPVPEAAARVGVSANRSYQYARDNGWPLVATGRGRWAVPKGFVDRLVEQLVAQSLSIGRSE